MKYGVVEDVGEGGQADLRWISVRVRRGTDGIVPVLATSLYSFKSAREAAAAFSNVSPERVIGRSAQSKFEAVTNLPPPPPDSGVRCSSAAPSSSEAAPASLSTIGPVGRMELVGVVNSLLQRANVPLDLERQAMLQRIMQLDELKTTLMTEATTERAEAEAARRALASSNARLKCQICISNQVTHCMTPCGHTICESCVTSLNRQACPFCRTAIRQSCRFYLEGTED
jgi:hypothetical protein